MKEKKKDKKIIFNESVDSSITGFSLACSLLVMGMFLQFNEIFFGNTTQFIKLVFIIVGIIGLCIEIEHLNEKFEIKGFENILIGFAFILGVYGCQSLIKVIDDFKLLITLCNLVLFILIFIVVYFISEGIIQMFYSIYVKTKDKKTNKVNIISRIIITMTQLASLVLILVQINDIINK